MQTHTEDTDQLGPYYKKRFEELTETPGDDVKDGLFAKMDILEGKRPRTIYLHFNLFGMKIAASITMLVVSSLALVAVAAVTVIAIRNNSKKKKTEMPVVPTQDLKLQETENTISTSPEIKSPKREIIQPVPSQDVKIQEEHIGTEAIPEEESIVPQTKQDRIVEPVIPVQKSGDNSKLLNEIDKEEDLFGK